MSAGTDIKTAEQRFDDLTADGWQGMNIAKVRDRLKDEERAELRAALEAAEQFDIPPASGASPCIEDRDGIPSAIRMVIQSSGSYGALRSLYRLINIWGAEQRSASPVQPDSERDAALAAILSDGYEGGMMVDQDLGGKVILYYISPACAENAFVAITDVISVQQGKAQPLPGDKP